MLADRWVRNFLGGCEAGRFNCMDSLFIYFFFYLGPTGDAKFHLLQDEYESLLDWHCTLPEILDLTPPFANDLAFLGFWVPTWQILFKCLNVHGL